MVGEIERDCSERNETMGNLQATDGELLTAAKYATEVQQSTYCDHNQDRRYNRHRRSLRGQRLSHIIQ